MSPAHGLTVAAQIYRVPDGVKYLIVTHSGDRQVDDLAQVLNRDAMQIVVDDGYVSVFVWPDVPKESR